MSHQTEIIRPTGSLAVTTAVDPEVVGNSQNRQLNLLLKVVVINISTSH